MATRIEEYIQQMKNSGYSLRDIRLWLKKAGWQDEQIDKALQSKRAERSKKSFGSNKTVIVIASVFLVAGVSIIGFFTYDARLEATKLGEETQIENAVQDLRMLDVQNVEWELIDHTEEIKKASLSTTPYNIEGNEVLFLNDAKFNGDYWLLWSYFDPGNNEYLPFEDSREKEDSYIKENAVASNLFKYAPGEGFKDLSQIFSDEDLIIFDVISSGGWWIIISGNSDGSSGMDTVFSFDGNKLVRIDEEFGLENITNVQPNYRQQNTTFAEKINNNGEFVIYSTVDNGLDEDFLHQRFFLFSNGLVKDISNSLTKTSLATPQDIYAMVNIENEILLLILEASFLNVSKEDQLEALSNYSFEELLSIKTKLKFTTFNGEEFKDVEFFEFSTDFDIIEAGILKTKTSDEFNFSILGEIFIDILNKKIFCVHKVCYTDFDELVADIAEFDLEKKIVSFVSYSSLFGNLSNFSSEGEKPTFGIGEPLSSNGKEILFQVQAGPKRDMRLFLYSPVSKSVREIYGLSTAIDRIAWNKYFDDWNFIVCDNPNLKFLDSDGNLLEVPINLTSDTIFREGRSSIVFSDNYISDQRAIANIKCTWNPNWFEISPRGISIYELRPKK